MRTKRGWTLVELLVTIAIIIVLAGITYAVIMYARERASQARCISNLRQIGVALKLYMEDYKQADWDTEIKGVDCVRINRDTARRLSDRWGFPPSLLHLVSAGYLRGGGDALRCRSCWSEHLISTPEHYNYHRPDLVINASNFPMRLNSICKLQERMYDYPIVVDLFHWRPNRGGVILVLRLNESVETKPFTIFAPSFSSMDL
jgi:prepilin-type N-terminal cleavage/methylation domain-containing protein